MTAKAPSSPVGAQPDSKSGASTRKGGNNPTGRGGFQKGQSGNPGGRSRINENFRERARKAVDAHVLEAWVREVESQGEEWVRCSELLAAYGYGKPSSAPEDLQAVKESGGGLTLLTRDELLRIARLPSDDEG